MTDSENNPPKAPTTKTSAVPLKKETVRITLRPSAPPSEPLAPVAPPAPQAQLPANPPPAPMAGGPPRPPSVGAPTVQLRSAPPPAVGGPKPSGPLSPPPPVRAVGGGPPPTAPQGSKTIPLQQPPGAKTPVAGARQTTRLVGGAPATQPLPKATVKLQKTQQVAGGPPTASIGSASIRTAALDEEDEVDREAGLQGLSIVAVVGAIAALLVAIMGFQFNKSPFFEVPPADTSAEDEWYGNKQASGFKAPAEFNPYVEMVNDNASNDKYIKAKPPIPERPKEPPK